MNQYFVAEPGKSPHGPYAEVMVKSACEQGMYPPGTKVWWEGATQWEQVELVFGKGAPDAVSPSLPPPPPVALPPAPPIHQAPQPEPVTRPQEEGTTSKGSIIGFVFLVIIGVFVPLSIRLAARGEIKFRGDFSTESVMWCVAAVFTILFVICGILKAIEGICIGIRKAYKFIRKWM